MPRGAATPSRALRAGAVALLVGSLALFAERCVRDPAIPFLFESDAAPWMGFPHPPDGMLGLAERDALPRTLFVRSFELTAPVEHARIELRALRRFRARLDGQPIGLSESRHWRSFQQLWLPALGPGRHLLQVEVTNPTGPALLALRSAGLAESLAGPAGWRVSVDGAPPQPAVALDTRSRNPSAYAMPSLAEGLRERAGWVLAALVLGTGASLALRGRRVAPRLDRALPFAIGALWLGPLLANAASIPLESGFDARHHVAYIEHLRAKLALPNAFDGWSMFHPPLYYVATAGAVSLAERLGAGGLLGWKLVGVLSGLAAALAIVHLAGTAFGRASAERRYATLLAGTLPMNAYIAAYVTNESLHAALAAWLVAATAALLAAVRPTPRALAGWVALAGAAALTKYTAWIVASVAGFFLVVAWWRIEGAPAGKLALRVAACALGVAALAGWFHVRAYLDTGQWFPLNVDLPEETRVWWAQPGYATRAFFTRFGEVLGHPFLAGTHSAWDAFYATLWGDGQLAGEMIAARRHGAWDWTLMAAGYALALPATGLTAAGAWLALRRVVFAPEPAQRAVFAFLLTLGWAMGLSVLYMTLRQPDYGLAKAFYGLAAAAPLCICFGLGAAACERALRRAAPGLAPALFHGWLASFVVASFGPYV